MHPSRYADQCSNLGWRDKSKVVVGQTKFEQSDGQELTAEAWTVIAGSGVALRHIMSKSKCCWKMAPLKGT